ncbi:hypothetical protein N7444_006847 [Penicillium canescens]|nr:hypothetical protein N7444_006847 [Penicillium canescens]
MPMAPTSGTNSGRQIGINNGTISLQFDPVNLSPEQIENRLDRACLRDLQTTDPRHDKERIETVNGGLLKDVYVWILDHADFKRWRYEQQSQLLWIKGDPGKGKTMLLCGIIDELATDIRINTATAVLRGLIFMLVDQQPLLISHIRRQYDKRGKQVFEDINAWEALSEILNSILEDPLLQKTFLIIDALDECTIGLNRLLELIAQKSSAYPHVKWIVSSRNWLAIENALDATSQKTKLCLELNETSVEQAVTAFIQHKVRKLTETKKYTAEIRNAVSQHLLSNAHGTFLWVAFVCGSLSRVPKRHVIKTLQKAPSGLDEIYARMLHQINASDDAELCKSLLSVIATVCYPMTLDELASCIDFPQDIADDHESLEEIIALCGSFLTLRGLTVSLIHQSAKDFLYRNQVLGLDHPGTLTSMGNLVNTYTNQGRWKEAEELQVQVMEARKQVLGPEHPDVLTSMNNLADIYANQGRWKEAEELQVQAMEARKQVPEPEHADTLELLAGAVAHNRQYSPYLEDDENSVDSHSSMDLSTGNESVFSLASIPSTRSLGSGSGEINSFLIQEFATLLHENGILLSLVSIGVSKQQIGFERMRNNFRRLLQHFANDLKAETQGELHRELRSFVSSYSAMITRELFAMDHIDEKQNIKPPVPEIEHEIASVERRSALERKVEDYLEKLRSDPAPHKIAELDEESDEDSVAEEAGEDEPYEEGSLQHVDQIKRFVLESTAYQTLLCRLEEFVQPSLYSGLRNLVTRWSIPDNRNHRDVVRYKLRNLVTELQHVNPHEIQFDCDQTVSRFIKFISHYQHRVERWTGERWDWWPLPRCLRPLRESETRLLWQCVSTHLYPAL